MRWNATGGWDGRGGLQKWPTARDAVGRDRGMGRTGRLADVAGGAGGLRPRKPPLGARAQSPVVAVLAIVTRYAAPSPCRAPPHPSTRKHPRECRDPVCRQQPRPHGAVRRHLRRTTARDARHSDWAGGPGCGGVRCGGPAGRGGLQGGRRGLGPEATQAAPRRSRPIGGGCCLADCHSLRRRTPASHSATPLHTQTDTRTPQPECT